MAQVELIRRNRNRGWMSVIALCSLIYGDFTPVAFAQPDEPAELSAEDAKQRQIVERFRSILEKSPRRGTALDRVYGYHVEAGTLENFINELKQKVKASPGDGAHVLLLGLFESQRGNDYDAVEALRLAESLRPKDPLVSYYLGQSLLLAGEPDKAVEAFERALSRKPDRTDLIEIFQQLGRVHQRAQRREQAIEVWKRMEALFPDDPRVLEQIAVTLVEEGDVAQALPRYEQLIRLVKDDYRRSTFRIQAAELKIKSGQKQSGLKDLEALLSDLNPDGWMATDVRRRIEDVFLRTHDQDGLVAYYENWLNSHPDDLDGIARLAKHLTAAGRVPEATEWLERALKQAPTRVQLRRAFIDQLVDRQDYTSANQQYRLLAEASPGNSDVLRDWGRLVLKDKSLSPAQRKAEATRIWKLMLDSRRDDAVTVAQVADLFRHAELNDEALSLYQQAVQLAPGDPQYREYLGEFYQILKRPDDALKTWKEMVTGDRKNAVNLSRLAEILQRFGQTEEALAQIRLAAELDPKDLLLQVKAAEYHFKASQHEQAMQFITTAEGLTVDPEERNTVLTQKIECLQASDRLEEETAMLQKTLAAEANASADRWWVLARYFEASRKWEQAQEAIETALQREPGSVSLLTTAARLAEASGNPGLARDLYRKLADQDRRSRGDHLSAVMRLSSQLGQKDAALQAGKDLILSAPGKTENYETYAQLCFQQGEPEEGFEALRKAIRINPTEPQLLTVLAAALAQQFKTAEAIELYWRAFEKLDQIDEQVELISKLTDLYLQQNQFEKLTSRLERARQSEEQRRAMTICLAQAYFVANEFARARSELESLLESETRDTELLQQLSKLCEQDQDLDAAIAYQRQIVRVAPSVETEMRLAQLYTQNGRLEEARELIVRHSQQDDDPVRLLRSVDSLQNQRQYEAVLSITEPLLRAQPENWELLYREGLALMELKRYPEAKVRFQQILDIDLPWETYGVRLTEQLKQAQKRAGIAANLFVAPSIQRHSTRYVFQNSYQIRAAIGLENRGYSYSNVATWRPEMFSVARFAAVGWQYRIAQVTESEAELIQNFKESADQPGATHSAVWNQIFLLSLQDRFAGMLPLVRRSIDPASDDDLRMFVELATQVRQTTRQMTRNGNQLAGQFPLEKEDLEFLLQCSQKISQRTPETSAPPQMQMQMQQGLMDMQLIAGVARELRIAGRTAEADELLQSVFRNAQTVNELQVALSLAQQEGLKELLPDLLERWKVAIRESRRDPTKASSVLMMGGWRQAMEPIMFQIDVLITEKKTQQAFQLFDLICDLSIEDQLQSAALPVGSPAAVRQSRQLLQNQGRTYVTIYGQGGARGMHSMGGMALSLSGPEIQRLLQQTTESLLALDLLSDLEVHLKDRVANAPPETKPYLSLMLVDFLWEHEQFDEAIEILNGDLGPIKNDPSIVFTIATLFQQRQQFSEALELVDGLVIRDQALLQRRELLALNLAERIGDTARARLAAERLFGMRLDTQTQLQLVSQFRRLGLTEMSDAIVARVQRQSGNQTPVLVNLMTLAQVQGNSELAKQMAISILRKQTSATPVNPAMIRFSSNESQNSERQQALKVLAQTGGLKERIQALEKRKSESPLSLPLFLELMELYQTGQQKDQVSSLFKEGIETFKGDPVVRLRYVQFLRDSAKTKEACEQLEPLLKEKPEWFWNDFYQVQSLFQQAQQLPQLARIVSEMNLKNLRDPWSVLNLVQALLSNEATQQEGEKLARKIVDERPELASQLLNNLHGSNIWKRRGIFEIGLKGILPPASAQLTDPWHGLDSVNSYGEGGSAEGPFSRLLTGAKAAGQVQELRDAISERLKLLPKWTAGQAMLALIDINAGQKEQGIKALQQLIEDGETLKDPPPQTCWLIGQELAGTPATQSLAVKLLRSAQGDRFGLQIRFSPTEALTEVLIKTGRKEEAKAELLKAFQQQVTQNYDSSYQAYMKIENTKFVGERLMGLGYPEESLKIYRAALRNSASFSVAANYYGRPERIEELKGEFERNMKTCRQQIQRFSADRALEAILPTDGEGTPSGAVVDLMLVVPDSSSGDSKVIESEVLPLLKAWKERPDSQQIVAKRISDLCEKHPEDWSVRVFSALWGLQQGGDAADAEIAQLLKFVADHPLDEIPAKQRPNARHRAQAEQVLPVWLVASACLADPARRESGLKLMNLVLEAGQRLNNSQFALAVYYETGLTFLGLGDKAQAESYWKEYLKLAGQRPESSARQTTPAGSGRNVSPGPRTPDAVAPTVAPSAIPTAAVPPTAAASSPKAQTVAPLTISQFRNCMELAVVATQNEMPSLSFEAVDVALRGGIPVEDISTAPMSRTTAPLIISSTGATMGSARPLDTITPQVTRSLKDLLIHWEGRNYPPEAVLKVLTACILPANRTDEILLFSSVNDANIVAKDEGLSQQLVIWAQRGGKIDEVIQQVIARSQSPRSKISGPSLLVRLELARNDLNAARIHLQELNQAAIKLPDDLELAAGAAFSAFDHPELSSEAGPLLLRIMGSRLDRLESESATAAKVLNNPWMIGLLRDLTLKGQQSSVTEFIDKYATIRQKSYARYGGTYGVHLQYNDFATIAEVTSSVGETTLALRYLGQVADNTSTSFGEVRAPLALIGIARDLSTRPAAERAEIWRKWTLPDQTHQNVRLVTAETKCFELPSEGGFNPSVYPVEKLQPLLQTSLISNFQLLVDAAAESGTLSGLKSQVAACRETGGDDAEVLWMIILMRTGELETARPLIGKYFAMAKERRQKLSPNQRELLSGEYLVWQELMRTPALADLLSGVDPQLIAIPGNSRATSLIKRIELDRTLLQRRLQGVESIAPEAKLEHWINASSRLPDVWRKHSPRWWVSDDNQLLQLNSSSDCKLIFRSPLSGDWAFDVDVWATPQAGVGVAMSGEVISLFRSRCAGNGWSGERELPAVALRRSGENLNHIRIESSQGTLTYFVNGQRLRETRSVIDGPWLQLALDAGGFSAIKQARLTGTPEILSEVDLIAGDRLSGWSLMTSEIQSPSDTRSEQPASVRPTGLIGPSAGKAEATINPDWYVVQGTLSTRKSPTNSEIIRSLRYDRPLETGDRVDYEFWYEPGLVEISPALGRWAFDLTSDGVSPRCLATSTWDDQIFGIPVGRQNREFGKRLGNQAISLQQGSWNRASLEVGDQSVVLKINDVACFESPRDQNSLETFGLSCRAGRNGRIRHARLTGNWPKSVDSVINLPLLRSGEALPAQERALGQKLAPIGFHRAQILDLTRTLKILPDEEAYQQFTAWVFPQEGPAGVQFAARLAPLGGPSMGNSSTDGLLAPVWNLVQLAAKTNRLGELKKRAEALPDDIVPTGPRQSLLALIALQEKDMPSVLAFLKAAQAEVSSEGSRDYSPASYAGPFVVCWLAAAEPELLNAAHELAEKRQKFSSENRDWQADDTALLARTIRLKRKSVATEEALSQWKEASPASAADRWAGHTGVDWEREASRLMTLPGQRQSDLYFASPLQGDFEVHATLSSVSRQQIFPLFGLAGVMPDAEAKKLKLLDFGRFERVIPWNAKEIVSGVGRFRITVKDKVATSYYNDVQVNQEKFTDPPAPWLVLRPRTPEGNCELNEVKITGSPTIPDEVNLLAASRMKGWNSAYFGHQFIVDTPNRPKSAKQIWVARGGELAGDQIVGGLVNQESLLQYCRPCFEDGEISIETYYKPDELEIAPALGRTAFLLKPDGIRQHQITRAQYDVDGLSPTNSEPIEGAAGSVPLKPDDWNQIKLLIRGDSVTVSVNGEAVAMTKLKEPPQGRFFGLFRYADQTGCRIRDVILRGDWPKTLPPIEVQELAGKSVPQPVSRHSPETPTGHSIFKTVLAP